MDSDTTPMTGEQSMELISRMILQAKNKVSISGKLYLLWGWLILICCLVQFSADHFFHFPGAYYIWFSSWILLIYQVFYLAKKRKRQRVRTYTEEINAFVWLVFFICMMLTFVIGSYFGQYEMINPLLLILYGMPTFLSGVLLKFRPLVIGGICCWVLSLLSMVIPVEYQLLQIAAAVIAAWIIPGYLLRIHFKEND